MANDNTVLKTDRLKNYFDSVLNPFNARSFKTRRWSVDETIDWYNDSTVSHAHRMMGELTDKKILEIGFGMGAHLIWLARKGARIVGIDISKERVRSVKDMVKKEELESRITLMCGDIRDSVFPNETFDIIYGHDILMYLEGDYLPFITKMRDALRVGGKMVIVEALNGHPIAYLYRKIFLPSEFKHFTEYFDIESLKVFKDNYRLFTSRFFYLLAPLAVPWKVWFASKSIFDYFEKRLSMLDSVLLKRFPVLNKYCWRVVFEAVK